MKAPVKEAEGFTLSKDKGKGKAIELDLPSNENQHNLRWTSFASSRCKSPVLYRPDGRSAI
jgi:hypothetical protein